MANPPTLEFERLLAGKRVLVTGHTGFTGSWCSHWLVTIGCDVSGYALAPETTPNLFEATGIASRLAHHYVADIRDFQALQRAFDEARPQLVLHLAAQPLVRPAYADPLTTFSTNVMGTANVLEAARLTPGVEALVCITTDKVYENREWPHPYREPDRLGGKDPYSASKAAAELVAQCYQRTLGSLGNGLRIATARGGNIIGGGDWSVDRIVPDYYRALGRGIPLVIRSPEAIRPWQHVLGACHGYLAIAGHLLAHRGSGTEAWNIGPADGATVTVRELIEMLAEHSPRPAVTFESAALPEAQTLLLDVHKAVRDLGFSCPWSTAEAIQRTAEWYRGFLESPRVAEALCVRQLADYRLAAGEPKR